MKKRKLLAALLVTILYVGSLGSARAFSPQPGTADDPLISVSYFNQAIQPLISRISSLESGNTSVATLTSIIQQLELRIVQLEARVAQLEAKNPTTPTTPPTPSTPNIPTTPTSPTTPTTPTQPTVVHGFINGTMVNIRSGAGTNFSIIATLPMNTRVDVLERGKDWHRVRLQDGRVGFVSAQFLRIP